MAFGSALVGAGPTGLILANELRRQALQDLASMVANRCGNRIETPAIFSGTAPNDCISRVWLAPDGSVHKRYTASELCPHLIRPDGYIG